MSKLTLTSSAKCFGGLVNKYTHQSLSTKTAMAFSVFLPPKAQQQKVPAVYFLSGLTCTEDNFIQKAGACKYAAAKNIALICPDTSPRGLSIAGEHDGWDFGSGAGFYVNATTDEWKDNYNMYDYVTKELPALVETELPVTAKKSVMGHSMGGHGALVCYLKNPGMYQSVSAFSPICNPTQCPWGDKAFTGYLGPDKASWEEYDATCLVGKFAERDNELGTGERQGEGQGGEPSTKRRKADRGKILIDQGAEDSFLKSKQLLPENFGKACQEAQHPVDIRMQEGYDHSYWFIQSFIEDHMEHHAGALSK